MLQAAIGVRRVGVARDRLGVRGEPPQRFAAAGGHRAFRHPAHRHRADQAADRRARLRRHQRRRRGDFIGLARRHLLRVRLSRRRRAAVRPEGARRGFHSRVPGAAGGAGDERADDAAVLLAHPAAGRARHGVASGTHARRRRRGRAFHRRQHLPRHGGSAAVHPAVSGATDAQRIVPGDDGRHGRHRRHRAGALRHAAGAADSRRRRAFRHRLRAGRAGGDPDQPDHGAGDQRRQDRRRA